MNQPANQQHAKRSSRRPSDSRQPALSGYGPEELAGVNPYAAHEVQRQEPPRSSSPSSGVKASPPVPPRSNTESPPAEPAPPHADPVTPHGNASVVSDPAIGSPLDHGTVAPIPTLPKKTDASRSFRVDEAESMSSYAPPASTVKPMNWENARESQTTTAAGLETPKSAPPEPRQSQTVELSLEALEALQQAVREVSLQNKQLGQQNSALFKEMLRTRTEHEQSAADRGATTAKPSAPPEGEQAQGASTEAESNWTVSTDTDSIEVESIPLPRIAPESLSFDQEDWIPASAVWLNDERWAPTEGSGSQIDQVHPGAHAPSEQQALITGAPYAAPMPTTPGLEGADILTAASQLPLSEPPVVSHRWDPPVAKAVPDPRMGVGNFLTAASDLDQDVQHFSVDPSSSANVATPPSAMPPNSAAEADADASPTIAMAPAVGRDEVDVLIGHPDATSDPTALQQGSFHDEPKTVATADAAASTSVGQAASAQNPIAQHDAALGPNHQYRIQAAWEVDYFRWPEVTHRLLRDEGQSLDTVLQTLRANQLNVSKPRVILVTGTRPSEGRSTLAISLARRAAAQGQRTLLVDGDLVRGQLDQAAGLEFPLGWMRPEADAAIDECLVRSLASNLFVMPQGEAPATHLTPSERYHRLWSFVERAAHGFDAIFVDAGLVEEFVDHSVPAPVLVDTALLVQGGVLGEGQSIVEAYRSLIHVGIKAIAVAETFGKRMAG